MPCGDAGAAGTGAPLPADIAQAVGVPVDQKVDLGYLRLGG